VTQTLFTASVLAEATPRIWDKDQDLALQNLSDLNLMLRGALAEMRSLLVELRSGDLHGQTLDQLIKSLVEAAQGRSQIDFNFSIQELPELEDKITLAIYRIAREALNNVIVHSGASQVKISLLGQNERIELQIHDNGHGFDMQTIQKGHLGIKIMNERTSEIGGNLSIHSEPGRGTEIILRWPGETGEGTSNG
jgi:signal transduction histidine kinase